MTQFKSFNNSTQKIQKSWGRIQENKNKLNEAPLISLNFNSINFNKKIITIPIVTDELIINNNIHTILLENFPESFLNMIEPTVVYTFNDGFINNLVPSNTPFFDVQIGQTQIFSQRFKYWFNHIDQKNFFLKIFGFVSIGVKITPNQFGSVPTFRTLSLKIINQRIYETMNSHKE